LSAEEALEQGDHVAEGVDWSGDEEDGKMLYTAIWKNKAFTLMS
jgi:hypothetical protein